MKTSTVIWSFTVAGLMTGGILPRADRAVLASLVHLLDYITSCYMFAKPIDGPPLLSDEGATFIVEATIRQRECFVLRCEIHHLKALIHSYKNIIFP